MFNHVGFFLDPRTWRSRHGMIREKHNIPLYEVRMMRRELLLMTAVTLAAAGCASQPQTVHETTYTLDSHPAAQASLVGPRGPAGPAGEMGEQGRTGRTGPAGEALAGPMGNTGPAGEAGIEAPGRAVPLENWQSARPVKSAPQALKVSEGLGRDRRAEVPAPLVTPAQLAWPVPLARKAPPDRTDLRVRRWSVPPVPQAMPAHGRARCLRTSSHPGQHHSRSVGGHWRFRCCRPTRPRSDRPAGRVPPVWLTAGPRTRTSRSKPTSPRFQASQADQATQIAVYMKNNPSLKCGIDATDPTARNQDLSDHRVKAIRESLIQAGVPAEKITSGAYGDIQLRRNRARGSLDLHWQLTDFI